MNYLEQVQDGDAVLLNSSMEELFPDNYSSDSSLNNSDEYYSSYPGGYLTLTPDMNWLPHTLFLMVFILGIPGNALVIFVLLRNGALRINTNIYLFNLAITDFLFLVLEVPAKIGVYVITPGDMSWQLGLGMCKFSIYVVYVNMAVSIITLTALAVNRYCAVMHPISTRTHRSRSQTLFIIASIWMIALASQVPNIMVGNLYYPAPHTACIEIWPSMASMRAFKTSLFVFFYVVPLFIITSCYIRMATMLWHSSDFGHASSASQASAVGVRRHQSRRRVARLVLVLVTGFAFCWLPYHTKNIQEIYYRHTLAKGTQGQYYYGLIARLLAYFNSCLNPFLYSFLGENFRVYFKKAFSCCESPCRIKRRILAPFELRLNGFAPTNLDDAGNNTVASASSRLSTRKSASSC